MPLARPLDGLVKPLSQISQCTSHSFILSIVEETVKEDLFHRKVMKEKKNLMEPGMKSMRL